MKVRFAESALDDLNEIREFLRSNYPSTTEPVEQRIRMVVDRIGNWPERSPRVIGYPAIHAAPLGRYPYRLLHGHRRRG